MLPRKSFLNKLRELKYVYSGETENTQKYKRGTHRVYVPKNVQLDDEWVLATLRQCGCNEVDIANFVRAAKA